MNNNFDLVDGVTSIMGGTATLFVRDGQDFTRVTTNVKKNDGSRAVGTQLNMSGGAGKAIQRGQAFLGQVDILGNPYLTAYSPMFNTNNEVVGIWYVGYSANLDIVKNVIASSRLLEEGFVGLLDDRGNLRMHSDNISQTVIEQMLVDVPDNWQIEYSDFNPWGYQIITGYSQSEVSRMVWSPTFRTIAFITLGGIVIVVCLSLLVQLVIGRPLNLMIGIIEGIADGEGDLTMRFNSTKKDELGIMARGFDKLLARLHETISDTKKSSNNLLDASSKLGVIASTSEVAVFEQTEQTEQVATAMHEMSATAIAVAESAARAETIARESDNLAVEGDALINQVLEALEQQLHANKRSINSSEALNEASDNIGSILAVIETIAEQTNLLALNAAIEAARAGEVQAMGDIISEGNNLSNKVYDLIKKTGSTINKLSESASKIRDTNIEMASTAEEQRQVSEDISERLERTRQIALTSQNTVVETNSAAESLGALAVNLGDRLNQYKT